MVGWKAISYFDIQHLNFKSMKNQLITIIGLFTLILSQGCKKEVAKCEVLTPEKSYTLTSSNFNSNFNVWTGGTKDNQFPNYRLMMGANELNSKNIILLLQDLNIDLTSYLNNTKLNGVVLYTNKLMEDKEVIKRGDIIGLLLYTTTNNKQLDMRFFNIDNQNVKLIPEISSTTNIVSTNHFLDIYKFILSHTNESVTAIRIKNNSGAILSKGKIKSNFTHNLFKFININKDLSSIAKFAQRPPHSGGGDCAEPCHSLDGTCDEDGPNCSSETCPKEDADETESSELTSYQNYSIANENSILRNFRDSILSKSALGNHLISDFYYAGNIAVQNMSISQLIDMYELLTNTVMPNLNELLNNSTSTEVLLTTTEANQLKAFIDDIDDISGGDATFLEILDEISDDIDYATGKTVSQVHSDLIND